jgi:hypothetical protein
LLLAIVWLPINDISFFSLKAPFGVERGQTQKAGLTDSLAGKEILGMLVMETCSGLQPDINWLSNCF